MKKSAAGGAVALALMLWLSCAMPTSAFGVDTTLCKMNEELCAAANRYPNGQALAAEGEVWELTTAIGNVVCDETSLGGKSTALEAEPLPGKIEALAMAECNLGALAACAVNPVHLPFNTALGWK